MEQLILCLIAGNVGLISQSSKKLTKVLCCCLHQVYKAWFYLSKNIAKIAFKQSVNYKWKSFACIACYFFIYQRLIWGWLAMAAYKCGSQASILALLGVPIKQAEQKLEPCKQMLNCLLALIYLQMQLCQLILLA